MIHNCNILIVDYNDDFYGIVYFYQIVIDVNVNVLNNKMNSFNVFLVVGCITVLIIKGYQTECIKFASIVGCGSCNHICV